MFVAARKWPIYLAQDIVGFIGTFTPGAVALLESEIGSMPFVGIGAIRPGSAIDLLFGVFFHPLHGWVLACLLVPVAVVDECLLGWERHVEKLRPCCSKLCIDHSTGKNMPTYMALNANRMFAPLAWYACQLPCHMLK